MVGIKLGLLVRRIAVLLIGIRGDAAPTWVVPCTNGWKVHAPLQLPRRPDIRLLRCDGQEALTFYAPFWITLVRTVPNLSRYG